MQSIIERFAILCVLTGSIFPQLQAHEHHWHDHVYVVDPWYHPDYVTPYGGVYTPVYYDKYPYYFYTPQYYYYAVPPAGVNVNFHIGL